MGFLGNLFPSDGPDVPKREARQTLRWSSLFLGELRDGLTMINMQSAFLIVSKNYTEKQAGILFFVFGMSQFLFQTPAGYLYDYSDSKLQWLSMAAIGTTLLTVFTATFALPYGDNLNLMILVKFLQGAITSFIPPGLNSITQGIVGAKGMTTQVAVNEMMNHLGTAIIVLVGSLLGVWLYPNLGALFVVSPIACSFFLFFLKKINPEDIDHNEARGLVTSEGDDAVVVGDDYKPPPPAEEVAPAVQSNPSFIFGWDVSSVIGSGVATEIQPDSPWRVLRDPILLTFLVIVFLFHMANGTVLPLVMQTLAIGSGRQGILLSGLCIIVAQIFMVLSAHICGTYSGKYGRKGIFLVGFFSVPVRCLILTGLLIVRGDNNASFWLNCLILSTQILDGVGAGVFGTMYILVTSDIAKGTGRFSMSLGLTTAAASIGGTVSGYLGEALAEDLGYQEAYFILMFLSLIPAVAYLLVMPETLADDVKASKDPAISTIQEEGESATDSAPKEPDSNYVSMT